MRILSFRYGNIAVIIDTLNQSQVQAMSGLMWRTKNKLPMGCSVSVDQSTVFL
jgi:hypothetical protein